MPFLDVSFNAMQLGDIVVLPFQWLSFLYSLTGLNKWIGLSYLITGTGILYRIGFVLQETDCREQKDSNRNSGQYGERAQPFR